MTIANKFKEELDDFTRESEGQINKTKNRLYSWNVSARKLHEMEYKGYAIFIY